MSKTDAVTKDTLSTKLHAAIRELSHLHDDMTGYVAGFRVGKTTRILEEILADLERLENMLAIEEIQG